MIEIEADIAVMGAGFSGSLTAMLVQRIGLRPVLIDRGAHPRFAIGESSTPVANLVLEGLAGRYDLPRIVPLSNYAAWKKTYPQIVCGLKRGFSYFHHQLGHDFQPRSNRANELLVAASLTDEDADTHWLRADFDQFLAEEAVRLGVPYFPHTSIDRLEPRGAGWELSGKCHGLPQCMREGSSSDSAEIRVRADFIIDASGEGGFLAKQLGILPHPAGLKTRSRGLFSHFKNVARWSDLYAKRGGDISGHPYPCDDAALHHVFDGGWMWVLPFDNGVTSAGFALDPERFPLESSGTPAAEWQALLARLPAVAEQFANAEPLVPWRQSGRMQRRVSQSAGPNWVMLPNTAAFHDPLHSTGNTFTLVGIERLIGILERCWNVSGDRDSSSPFGELADASARESLTAKRTRGSSPEPQWTRLADALQNYDALIQQEVEFIDLVVSGSYAGFREFERMIAMSMFYFATAIWSEEERRAGRVAQGAAYLSAQHPQLKSALKQAYRDLTDPNISGAELTVKVRAAIAPFNRVGLCNPDLCNMYPYEFTPAATPSAS
ncbi:NAD(P)/FAD-dependent oxidoreductase [Schlesneria sp.]|uniref:NAD(P)/FAD-dependent oxidoreductase n=1 Tax=Schlesneria sp. TaxID=2762018 RepID=UPI002F050409